MTTYHLRPPVCRGDGSLLVGDVDDRGHDRLLLGELAESGVPRRVFLDASGEQVVCIVGKRGTGKSYTLGTLLEGLACKEGRTAISDRSTPRGAIVLDLMDIFWSSTTRLTSEGPSRIRAQWENLKGIKPEDIDINVDIWVPGGYESDIDVRGTRTVTLACWQLTAEDWAHLMDVDLVNEPRGQLLFEVLHKVQESGWSNGNEHQQPNPRYGFGDMLRCIEDDAELKGIYTPGTLRAIRQRLLSYSRHSMFDEQGTDLQDLIRPWQVSVVLLGRLEDPVREVLVSILIRRIMRARQRASFARKRLELAVDLSEDERCRLQRIEGESIPRTWVLIDEAHNLVPADERTISGEALIKYAKEGRNIGLSLAVATQQPSAIDSRLMSQVETLMVHQLTAANDISIAIRNIKSAAPTEIKVDGRDSELSELIRQLDRGVAFISSANGRKLERACVAAVRPRVTAHGGYEA